MKNKKKILITGGNGYIGSCLSLRLEKKFLITIIDKKIRSKLLSKKLKYYKIDLKDKNKLLKLLIIIKPDIVIHLAGQSTIDMVEKKRESYYLDNYIATKNLIECIKKLNIPNLIFSSTAAVYKQRKQKLSEKSNLYSSNEYGLSKIKCESEIKNLGNYNTKYCILRFFNVSSSIVKYKIGEFHNPETHLIPLILQVASGRKESIKIYGNDYPTFDGTCIRDYIHVIDLCQAHHRALEKLLNRSICGAQYFNLGNGNGFSVKQVIDVAKKVVKKNNQSIKVEEGKSRVGDPAVLVADASAAIKKLEWQPRYPDLVSIIEHAWHWECIESGAIL